ncbi:RidA family protein [Rhizosphaericola mali]|uniref:RidA family protein n=1 Tax=Rhizosphaericola mali TaxID=2545455 RepID=A0A5P2G6R8_9BACT|nr:RidA family protein [Rhizosphaericola mali]QES89959.1 RidA family protein [Rhizosphaericola mali]
MAIEIINTKNAPAPIGPYNQSVKAGNFLFVSGQIPLDPISMELVNKTVDEETHQVFKNILAILKEAGATLDNVVKVTVFLSDMSLFAQVNEIYGSYFTKNEPARECVAVKTLPKNVNVEISVTAYLD